MEKVSCVIPVYNESERLRPVLEILSNHFLIDEIIVVDDGSTDSIDKILKDFPTVKVFRHITNKGKSAALYSGITKSSNPIIALIDADLIGLSTQNVTDLIKPIIENKVDVTLSLRKSVAFIERIIGLDYISGERVFHKEILQAHLSDLLSLSHFGFEVWFNEVLLAENRSLAVISWKNVISPYPTKKFGIIEGMKRFFGMIRDIVKTVSVFTIFKQNIAMYRLKNKYDRS